MMTNDARDLRTAALAMGASLPALVVAMSELRDESAERGDMSRARFWSALAVFLAQTRDEATASIRAMEHDIADAHVTIVPIGGGNDIVR